MPRLTGALLVLGSISALRGQSSWSTVNSTTTQNLRGVCYGRNLFVAVGEGGAILTSPDGMAWTARTSGTTLTLNAVAYAPAGYYYAVGAQGTILRSSDGITWTADSTTGQTLNAISTAISPYFAVGNAGEIRYSTSGFGWATGNVGDGRDLYGVAQSSLVAVGAMICGDRNAGTENSYLWTSVNGTTFSKNLLGNYNHTFRAIASKSPYLVAVGDDIVTADQTAQVVWTQKYTGSGDPNPRSYNGVTIFNGYYVAVGRAGAITYGPPRASGASAVQVSGIPAVDLAAVASSDQALVAVGARGTILYSTAAQLPPAAFLTSPSTTIYAQVGSGVLLPADFAGVVTSLLWTRNGQPVSNPSTPVYQLPSARVSDSGDYVFTATNAYGSTASATYHLVVSNSANASPAPVDPTFLTSFEIAPHVIPQPDGRLLVWGGNVRYPTAPFRQGIARLNADGSYDPTFNAGSGTSGSNGINQVLLQPDGKIILIGALTSFDDQPVNRCVRLNPDGRIDSSFAFTTADPTTNLFPLDNGGFVNPVVSADAKAVTVVRLDGNGNTVGQSTVSLDSVPNVRASGLGFSVICTGTRDDQGRVYVVITGQSVSQAGSAMFRLTADGQVDSSFTLVPLSEPVAHIDWIQGRLCYFTINKTAFVTIRTLFTVKFGKFNLSGAVDPSFQPVTLANAVVLNAASSVGCFDAGGGLYVTDQVHGLVHYDSAGRIDPAFSAQLNFVPQRGGEATVTGLTLAGSDIILGGNFTSINGVNTQDLARLHPVRDAYATRLSNFSIRSSAGTGDQTLITGFIVTGTGTKNVLIRGIGPTLASFGVAQPVADPALRVFRGSDQIATNDNWDAALATTFAQVGAFSLPPGSKDAALSLPLAAANYSAHVTASATGVALAEFYDLDATPTSTAQPRFANLSARSFVGTGDNTLIGGFIVAGPGTKTLLIRAVGPGLSAFGVGGVLANPQLKVFAGTSMIAQNDDWNAGGDAVAAPVVAATTEVNAFPLTFNFDSAVLVTLPAGVYSAQVTGVGGATGVALLEVYEVP